MSNFVFGLTATRLPIMAYRFGSEGPPVLVLGGVHGDEIEGIVAAHGLLEKFTASFPWRLRLTLVPIFNLDGALARERRNARGVDLNRNLPTKDWTADVAEPRYSPGDAPNSEPENLALTAHIESERPSFILSLHSWKPTLNINGDCRAIAESIARRTGYAITGSIGYPTPGCLGTYAGLERGLPTLTYEIERGLAHEPILDVHVPAILEGLKTCEARGR